MRRFDVVKLGALQGGDFGDDFGGYLGAYKGVETGCFACCVMGAW
jgi:hypothetical protein